MKLIEFGMQLGQFMELLGVHMSEGWTAWWQSGDERSDLPPLSDRAIRNWMEGNLPSLIKWEAFLKRVSPEIKQSNELQARLDDLNNLYRQIWLSEQQKPLMRDPGSKMTDIPEPFKRVFGGDGTIYLIYSELTLNSLVPQIIDAYEDILPHAPASVVAIGDPVLRKQLKDRPLVTYDPKKHHGKDGYNFRAEHSACVCEVRAAAYLAAELSRSKFVRWKVVGNAHPEVYDKADLSFISFGTLINSKSQEILKDPEVFVDFKDGRFISKRPQPDNHPRFLHPPVDGSSEYDYGLIVRIHPRGLTVKKERVWIACAGVQQKGTSAAARVLATAWEDEIAPELKREGTRFVALVKVPRDENKSDDWAKLEWIATCPEELERHESKS